MGLPITVTPSPHRWQVRLGEQVLGETSAALLLQEAGHGPVLYVPRADMDMGRLTPTDRRTMCPWKGQASYFSVGDQANVVWSYEAPYPVAEAIAGHLAFYPVVTVARLD